MLQVQIEWLPSHHKIESDESFQIVILYRSDELIKLVISCNYQLNHTLLTCLSCHESTIFASSQFVYTPINDTPSCMKQRRVHYGFASRKLKVFYLSGLFRKLKYLMCEAVPSDLLFLSNSGYFRKALETLLT